MHTEMTQTTRVKLFFTIEIVLAFKLSMDVQKNTTCNKYIIFNSIYTAYAIGYHTICINVYCVYLNCFIVVYLYAMYRTYV